MTFGQIKTITENYLLSSYGDKEKFKNAVLEFKKDILSDKNITKIYSIYEDLSTPQGLNEKDAQQFLDEGVKLIQEFLKESSLPKTNLDKEINNYKEIDNLVYIKDNFTNLQERINDRKKIISILMESKKSLTETPKIPISSMVSIANKNLKEYFDSLDESSKTQLFEVLNEGSLENFEILKQESIKKLTIVKENEKEEIKEKINETIEKIKNEEFNHLNFLRLKNLSRTL